MLSFKTYLEEKVLSIGLNPKHEPLREKHRQEFHDMLRKSYEPIGGYSGLTPGSKEESDSIHHDITHSLIKATRRDGKISSLRLYKKSHGRKGIAVATDGSRQGITDFKKTSIEDHTHKRAWAEVSGAPEAISRKLGVPVVDSSHAARLTGKDVKVIDKEKYSRKIGNHDHVKVIMGHPKDRKKELL